jgi:hypothetical protein
MANYKGVMTDEFPSDGKIAGVLASSVANGSTTAATAVTPGTSPAQLLASARGHFTVSGGTVSAIALVRNGVSTTLPGTSGIFPVSQGDTLSVTYSVVPTVEFIPF